ncbi:CHASE2 domain-containing protein [Planktothrix paucivesiculata]|uniref:Adenylate/guanylate cyclase n=1 Tax=Planktothrix paucivesiculata PCC 9631 TaxID=671071 RepID=A0A7Z9BV50_9CYAN|nr:adenylate/guanylate cyclase domain-containing protein [Planktothrix paucivesiculata]VXD23316.1 Adenylate/guanylate cyclase [Planktothrix paucivesiculata PCC 9631]
MGKRLRQILGLPEIILTGFTLTIVFIIRQFGGLQPLELKAYDLMVRSRPDPGIDSRLLIVEITETDIQTIKQWPIPDGILAQVLANLQQHQPRAIGIDIYRDLVVPPGHGELVKQLQKPNIIAVTSIGTQLIPSISPPPTISSKQVGFVNIPIDPDGVVRRQLIFAKDKKTTLTAFSLQLALLYLESEGILPKLNAKGQYQLGNAVFDKLQSNSGGYQNIDAKGYKLLLNYRTPQKIAQTITLMEILQGNYKPELVQDKIVLIGTNSFSVKDEFLTPYQERKIQVKEMPGIEVHAQIVSQILSAVLDGKPLFRFWSEYWEYLWIITWGILGSYWGWKSKHPLSLITGFFLGLIVLLGVSYGLFLQLLWIPIAAPILAYILTFLGIVIHQTWEFQEQQKIVMKLLGQQTSSEIANALWNERSHLINSGIFPPQTLTATILFTDLKNFSTIAEKQSSEDLMNWLNQYLGLMTDIVLNHHGIVSKFTGDGLMAVFGVPVPRIHLKDIAKDAENAVNCALEMGQCLSELNQKWQQQNLPEVRMRIGIYTGVVTVGSLGGKNRLEYGVIGDSVNIASRLESCEKDRHVGECRILTTKETLIYLPKKYTVESWGELTLKGRKKSVEVYQVLGL